MWFLLAIKLIWPARLFRLMRTDTVLALEFLLKRSLCTLGALNGFGD